MREEYIGQLEPYATMLPEGLRTRFRLERLDRQGGLEASNGPMTKYGRSFATGVAENLVDALLRANVQVEDGDASRTVEVTGEFLEPLQLQIVCQELWNIGAKRITSGDIKKIGSVDNVLSRFYDQAVRSAAQRAKMDEQRLRVWCENSLITSLGTRSLVYKEQWKKEGIPDEAINELERKHVLRVKARAGAYWYELVHDRFIGPIKRSNKDFLAALLESKDVTSQKAAHVDDLLRTSGLEIRRSSPSTRALSPGPRVDGRDNSEQLLKTLVEEIRKDIPFDLCIVSVLSPNMKEARIMFVYPREGFVRNKRWYRIPEFLQTNAWSRKINFVNDLRAFAAQFRTHAKTDVEKLYNAGYSSLLRYPVLSGGRVVAAMSLLSKGVSYSDKHRKLLTRITAIEKSLMSLVYSEQTHELQFRFDLLKELFTMTNNKRIVETLPTALAEHYRWETVAIFSIDKHSRTFTLVGQNCPARGRLGRDHEAKYCLPDGYVQGLEKGILGVAFSGNRDIRIGDIDNDARYRNVYVRSRKAMKSELCMRILVDGEIRWLLNIEDSQVNAFSSEEQRALRDLLDQVGVLLERITTTNLIAATFDATLAAVLVTDDRGVIKVANPSAGKMLGLKGQHLQGTKARDYFVDPNLADHVLTSSRIAPIRTAMRSIQGNERPVVLSSSALHAGAAGHVLSIQYIGVRR
jgi:PAS domain S-box-containing protein